jgi:uncharacterized protein YbjQ (UPF0145 family)
MSLMIEVVLYLAVIIILPHEYETVMQELKREAHAKGANAVIAVDIDYTQLGAGGNMMMLVSASGTAVIIEE